MAAFTASAQGIARTELSAIDARQATRHERIERGVEQGDLRRHEARTLRQEQRDIATYEARAKADGRVTRTELAQLNVRLDRADAHIRALRHNREDRRPG